MAEPAPKTAPAVRESTTVIVRPYPKIVYLYLTWLVSIVCGILQKPLPIGETLKAEFAGESALVGRIWIFTFIFNVLVISFEFTRIRSVAIIFAILAFVFAGIEFGFLAAVGAFLRDMPMLMNETFYFVVAAVFTIIYLLVFITTRFNYWEFQPNEILHHHGFLGDVRRYPTRGLRMQKEITDVLEHILLRAGTLVLEPPGVDRPIVLENVINLNKVEDKIQRLLGTLKVRLDEGMVGGPD
ncbi:MAG: hypothetical protein L6Q95_18470 [Planctomycetes bacterium]|nr:hypothetical protein [Planctomycetota bacterium]